MTFVWDQVYKKCWRTSKAEEQEIEPFTRVAIAVVTRIPFTAEEMAVHWAALSREQCGMMHRS